MFDVHIIARHGHDHSDALGIGSALRAAEAAGLSHAGLVAVCSDMDFAFLSEYCRQVKALSLFTGVTAWAGVELRHIPPALMSVAVEQARKSGAQYVMAYGESILDPAERGTDFAAINAGVDILASPGVLDAKTVQLAAEKNVFIEFCGSPVHALVNARAAALCMDCGCGMVCGSSASCRLELHALDAWVKIVEGASSSPEAAHELLAHIQKSEGHLLRRLAEAERKS